MHRETYKKALKHCGSCAYCINDGAYISDRQYYCVDGMPSDQRVKVGIMPSVELFMVCDNWREQ